MKFFVAIFDIIIPMSLENSGLFFFSKIVAQDHLTLINNCVPQFSWWSWPTSDAAIVYLRSGNVCGKCILNYLPYTS